MEDTAARLARLEAELIESKFIARQAAEAALSAAAKLTALECLAQALIETHPDVIELGNEFSRAVSAMLTADGRVDEAAERKNRACIDVLRWLAHREDPAAFRD